MGSSDIRGIDRAKARRKWAKRAPETPDEIVECLGIFTSLREVARCTPATYHQVWTLAREAVRLGLVEPLNKRRVQSREDRKKPVTAKPASGRMREMRTLSIPLPAPGKVSRFIFSCVQNDTALNKPVFDNMRALLAHYRKEKRCERAELHLARITYVHAGLGDIGNKDYVTEKKSRSQYHETMTYPTEVEEFFSDERIAIAPGLVWCGEVNILPTAERPLSGFESYTGRRSGIFPHTKVAMESIASMPGESTKFNFTTGALTVRNYIARKAGLKADFHHTYGGLLVEVDSAGNFWCRQLLADEFGTMYDIDLKVADGTVTQGNWIDSIVWGDIHVAIMDSEVRSIVWDEGGLLDRLQPKRQFFHDVLDFRTRSHHEIRHPMKMFQKYIDGRDSVEAELKGVREFLEHAERDWCDSIVVNSNHDRHLGRWLNEQDARFDLVNVEIWSRMWVACTDAIRSGNMPNYLAIALEQVGYAGNAIMLNQDESFIVCHDESGGIECGAHGDDGPNGQRGSALAFARLGRRMVGAHTHRAGIVDGYYCVGTNSILRPDYVVGPSASSHTECLIYENGKRVLVTIWAGRERA